MSTLLYSRYNAVLNSLIPKVESVLDVGCRDAILRQYLVPKITYTGIDLYEGPFISKVCNIEAGIPFDDESFDAVIALDLLEHTENIWFVFDEMVRVARYQVIISLPNLYHWSLRLRYLIGSEFGKYRLPLEPVVDRHRWLVSYKSAHSYCRHMANRHGLKMVEKILFGGKKTFLADAVLNLFSKNLGTYSAIFIFYKI